jgi:hypothetical protein
LAGASEPQSKKCLGFTTDEQPGLTGMMHRSEDNKEIERVGKDPEMGFRSKKGRLGRLFTVSINDLLGRNLFEFNVLSKGVTKLTKSLHKFQDFTNMS